MTTTIGPLTVSSPCEPAAVLPFGFALPCGGMLTNGGPRPVTIDAQVQVMGDPSGPPIPATAPTPVHAVLAPKTSLTLPDPGAGLEWIVVFQTRASIRDVEVAVVGGAVVLVSLAGVGLADIARHLLKPRKKRR